MAGSFSARLAELRKSKGISQKEAAKELGISQALLSHYEKGIRECSLDFLRKASQYYNVTSDYLLGLSESKVGIGDSFDENDLSQDNMLTLSTIYRSASILKNSLSKNAAQSDDFMNFLSVGLYRLISSAATSGNLPADWLSYEPSTAFELSNVTSSRILKNISAEKGPKLSKSAKQPLCVKTLIQGAESSFPPIIDSLKPKK